MPVIILDPIIAVQTGGGSSLQHVPIGDTINAVMSTNATPENHLVVSNWNEGSSWAPWKAFNHANTDLGWAGRPVSNEVWIAYQRPTAELITKTRITSLTQGSTWVCNSYKVYGTNDAFTDEASANEANWTLLDTVSCPGLAAGVWSDYFEFENDTAYSGYKFEATSWGSNGVQIQEIELVSAGPISLIPAMTSATEPSGTVSASSGSGSTAPWKLFDGLYSLWYSDSGTTQWIQYQFDVAQRVTQVSVTSSNNGDYVRCPNEFTIVGSNTGAFSGEETVLLTVDGSEDFAQNETKTWDFTASGSFTHYRMNITGKQQGFGYGTEYLFNTLSFNGPGFAEVAQEEEPVGGSGVDLIPAMTSATSPSGVASSSGDYGASFAVWKAMDQSTGVWYSNGDDTAWIQYEFTEAKNVGQMKLTATNNGDYVRAPNVFTLHGSNTGDFTGEETLLLTANGEVTFTQGGSNTWNLDVADGSFTHFRLSMTGKQQGAFGYSVEYIIDEWQLISGSGATVTVPEGVVNLIPAMTSYTDPSGTASSSSNFSETFAAWKSMDQASGNWQSGSADTQWLQYQFDTAQTIYQLKIAAINTADYVRCPNEFTIVGSNTGAFAGEETLLLTVDDSPVWTAGEEKTWTFDAVGEFTHYRMNITGKSGAFGYGAEYIVDSWSLLGVDESAGSVDLIPAMTSATDPSGTVSASSGSGGTAPWYAFNQGSGVWYSDSADTQWIQYQFDEAATADTVTLTATSTADYVRCPNEFTIVGSNTGAFAGEETLLLTVTDNHQFTAGSSNTWDFDTTGSFTHYRMNITGKQGGFGVGVEYIIDEMQFTGTAGTGGGEGGGEGGGATSGETINPIMTAADAPSPNLVVSNWYEGASWAPYLAFNHNNSDLGWAGRPVGGELWIAYKNETAEVVNQTRVTAYTGSWELTSYEVYGTNDDFTDQASAEAANWTLLDTVSSVNTSSGVWSPYYSFSNTTAYKAYKLRVTGWGSKGAQIQEIEFVAA